MRLDMKKSKLVIECVEIGCRIENWALRDKREEVPQHRIGRASQGANVDRNLSIREKLAL
jgi:hypothetical protein